MNRFLYIFAFATISTSLVAQPTITSANYAPTVGVQIDYYYGDISNWQILPGGANTTWDYSGLVKGNGAQTTTYIHPSTTPYASDYPNAGLVESNNVNTSDLYYFRLSGNNYYTDGYVIDLGSNGTAKIKFDTDPQKLMEFPFTYGDSFQDNFSGNAQISFAVPTITGNVTIEADGYGTLKLPHGRTFSNVLRVKRVETSTTSSIPLVGSIGIDVTNYYYYDLTLSSEPIFSFLQSNVNNDLTKTIVSQYPLLDFPVSTKELTIGNTKTEIYPNPTKENTTLKLSTTFEDNIEISIFDQLGKVMIDQSQKKHVKAQSEVKIDIQSEDLQPGIYYVKISGEHHNKVIPFHKL